MKFSTKEDIEAPIDAVFEMICDFESFERSAMRRGAEVQRVDKLYEPGVGMAWKAAFEMRGKKRHVDLAVVAFDRPNDMEVSVVSSGLDGALTIGLIPLSRTRTRVAVSFEMKPQNLSARLLIQSMKLAKTSLTKRYKSRVEDYAKSMESRYAKSVTRLP